MRPTQILFIFIFLIYSCNTPKDISEEKIITTVEKQFPKLESDRYNVSFLIMDGIFNTELTAPFDIF
jgi:hypothetical protein